MRANLLSRLTPIRRFVAQPSAWASPSRPPAVRPMRWRFPPRIGNAVDGEHMIAIVANRAGRDPSGVLPAWESVRRGVGEPRRLQLRDGRSLRIAQRPGVVWPKHVRLGRGEGDAEESLQDGRGLARPPGDCGLDCWMVLSQWELSQS